MSRTSTLITLGVLVILMPFSGLPASIRTSLLIVFGAIIASIGLAMRLHEARGAHPTPSAAEPAATSEEPAPPTTISPM